jgi:hypothetical protein
VRRRRTLWGGAEVGAVAAETDGVVVVGRVALGDRGSEVRPRRPGQ